jgi:hypothetical protein
MISKPYSNFMFIFIIVIIKSIVEDAILGDNAMLADFSPMCLSVLCERFFEMFFS